MNLETLVLPLQVSSSAFNSALKVATAGVAAAVAAMGLAIKATFDWANDLDKLGDVMGGTNTELAALNFVARKSGVSVDALAKGTVILSKGLVDAKGKLDTTGKALKEWGVNVFDANGALKDQTTLMGDIATKYGEFSTQQEKVNFLTEVFGRSGAELVDFFDTLAAEGGIDAVTKKVEALGLAIDPNRYEQFNRNLEEMKLIGLGLAVGFTEHLMPAFEAVSKWALTEGIPAIKKFGKEVGSAFDKGGVLGVADMLLDKFDDIDFTAASQKLIDGINSIDWSQAGMDFSALVSRIGQSLSEAFGEGDAGGVGNALASALNNFIAGALFGTDEAGLQIIVQTKLAELRTEFEIWAAGMPSSLDGLDAAINAPVTTALNNVDLAFANWSIGVRAKVTAALQSLDTLFATWSVNTGAKFTTWAAGIMATVATWGTNMIASASASMEILKGIMDAKINAITEKFVTRFSNIPRKAAEGFNASKQILIDVVSSVVDAINAILKKIITSFKLTFGGVNWGTGGETGNVDTIGGGGGGGSCFIAGTLVTLSDRTQTPIEAVQAGDRVLSWHKDKYIETTVTEVFHHPPTDAPDLVRINGILTATPEHLIYTNRKWVPAGFLVPSDELLKDGKEAKVTSLEYIPGFVPVYNLHTDHESHNYFADGILVHNSKNSNVQGMSFGGAAVAQSGGGTTELGNATIDRLSERLSLDLSTAIVRASNSV